MLEYLKKFRHWSAVDWALTRSESYLSFLDQTGLRPYAGMLIQLLGAVVLGAWALIEGAGWPIAIAIVICTYVAFMNWRVLHPAHMLSIARTFSPKGDGKSATSATAMGEAVESELAELNRNIQRINRLMIWIEEDNKLLRNLSEHLLSIRLIDIVLSNLNPIVSGNKARIIPSRDELAIFIEINNKAFRDAINQLTDTYFIYDIQSYVANCEHLAEEMAKNLSDHDIPAGVDRLDLRRYYISTSQNEELVKKLLYISSEMQSHSRQYQNRLASAKERDRINRQS